VNLTFFHVSADDKKSIVQIVLTSRDRYRSDTVPLGIGFMFKTGLRYGVDIEG
jgi:alpha-glucuronidase